MIENEFSFFEVITKYLNFIENKIKNDRELSIERLFELLDIAQRAVDTAFSSKQSPLEKYTVPYKSHLDLIIFEYNCSISAWVNSIQRSNGMNKNE